VVLDHYAVTAATASGSPTIKVGIETNLKLGARFDNVTVVLR
jgi:hypothetical protein